MSSVTEKIIFNINRLLSSNKLSVSWLAEKTGISRPQLSNYLLGKVKLPLDKAEQIADVLDVGLEELLSTPPASEAPPREPTELEVLALIVNKWEIHPERKALILGLLKNDYLEQERADVIAFALEAEKLGDVKAILKAVNGIKELRSSSKKEEKKGAG